MTDQRDILARVDVKVQVRKDGRFLCRITSVREGDVLKVDVALYVRHLRRVRGILDIRLDADHLIESLKAGHAVLELLGKADELSDRLGEVIYVKKERDQVLKRQCVFSDHERSDGCDDDRDQAGGCPENGMVDRHVAVVVALAHEEHIVAFGELMDLHILAGEGLDDADAGEAVFHAGVDLGDLFTVLFERSLHLLIEDRSEDDHERDGNQRDER